MVSHTRRWMVTSGLALAAAVAAAGDRRVAQQAAAPGAGGASADGRRLRARRTVHDLQHDAAGAPIGRPADVAAGRPVLVPRDDDRERERGVPGRPGEGARRCACDLPACAAAGGGGRGRPDGGGRGGAAAAERRRRRPTASAPRSSATGTCGCATSPPARKRSSRPTASRTSATPPTTPAGRSSDRPIVVWSPDSKKIATFQQDQRNVGEMYLVNTKVGHPSCRRGSIRCPATTVVTMIQRVVIDVDAGRRSCASRCRPISTARRCATTSRAAAASGPTCSGAPTRRSVAFVSTSRDHKHDAAARRRRRRPARCATCSRRRSPTFFESGNGRVNWRYLPASNEVIWFSERDNWGQLYLYDLQTGKLKNQITSGDGNVTQLLRVDEKSAHAVTSRRSASEKGRDPYFTHLYRVGLDGKGLALLTPEDADHDITLSPSGELLRRQLFEARRAAGRGPARRERQARR